MKIGLAIIYDVFADEQHYTGIIAIDSCCDEMNCRTWHVTVTCPETGQLILIARADHVEHISQAEVQP